MRRRDERVRHASGHERSLQLGLSSPPPPPLTPLSDGVPLLCMGHDQPWPSSSHRQATTPSCAHGFLSLCAHLRGACAPRTMCSAVPRVRKASVRHGTVSGEKVRDGGNQHRGNGPVAMACRGRWWREGRFASRADR